MSDIKSELSYSTRRKVQLFVFRSGVLGSSSNLNLKYLYVLTEFDRE